ncbi:MAG: M28 family peptidase [Bacteroides sp.]|nr:M28 family peptidase [Bacteroides sp.]
MNIEKTLETLCALPAVSGGEKAAHETVIRLLSEYTDDVKADDFGNVIGCTGNEDKPTLLLDAHIDRIGMIVTYIDDGGFVKVGEIGVDMRTLLAQNVTIYGKEKVKGVISTLPPHVAEDKSKAPKLEDIAIDVGMSKEQAEKVISLGDLVVLEGFFSRLAGSRVCTPASDDRAGVVSVLYALDLLKGEKNLPFRLAVEFSSQEEVGCRGAAISAFNVNPDYAIAFDVSFGASKGVEPEHCGKLGKGPMIGISPALDRRISDRLIQLAKEKEIPYQTEVMNGRTGTNADNIAITRGGVRTGLISIPQRYMHTPCEVLDLDDIKHTGQLLAEFVLHGSEGK